MRLWPFHFIRSKPNLPLMFLNFKTLYFQTFQEKRIGSISQFPFHYFCVLMQVLLISKSEGESRYISFELFQYLFGRFCICSSLGLFVFCLYLFVYLAKLLEANRLLKIFFNQKRKDLKKEIYNFFRFAISKKSFTSIQTSLGKFVPPSTW